MSNLDDLNRPHNADSIGYEQPKELGVTQVPRKQGVNKALVIAVVALLAMIGVLVALLVTRHTSDDAAKSSSQTSKSAQAPDSTRPDRQGSAQSEHGSAGNGEAANAAPKEVPDNIRKIIDSQHRLNPDDPRAKGKVNARLVVEIYADFRCGHCANFSLNVEPKLKKMIDDGTIRYEFNSLPVLGEESVLAAQAAQAAANQGMFWQYHDALYEGLATKSVTYTADGLTDLAKTVGIKDVEKFRADLTSPQTVEAVRKELENGRQLGINGTPAFLIGYQYVPGGIPFETFNQIVNSELKREKAA
ncbi:protein-disulfide isomerase [Arcanobacterium pluranimalium]|uniref:DsbA family protein n=1 Tax=Arcanobacterium pluranimalium TaxID=108028 RepID=UPI001958969D|nr:thioredoxin domain-containing protein [Arcanobacterium pluranimalium]MBM7824480.1 protein-disulfide isomerase [Arcanobacterium pluranimalium]